MARIVIIVGHALPGTYCGALAEAYMRGAESAGHQVSLFNTASMTFDPILRGGYRSLQALEPDLAAARTAIQAADHMVIIFPLWLGTLPAIFKGFLERVIQPDIFEPAKTGKFATPWKGKSARIVGLHLPLVLRRARTEDAEAQYPRLSRCGPDPQHHSRLHRRCFRREARSVARRHGGAWPRRGIATHRSFCSGAWPCRDGSDRGGPRWPRDRARCRTCRTPPRGSHARTVRAGRASPRPPREMTTSGSVPAVFHGRCGRPLLPLRGPPGEPSAARHA